MPNEINLAEEAFVNALTRSMKTQAEMLALQKLLNGQLQQIASANERVLRSRGITENSPLEDVIAEQQRYLEEAIKRSGLDEDHDVVKALRHQVVEMEEQYKAMSKAMDSQLGKIQGSEL